MSTLILMLLCFVFGIYIGYKKQNSTRIQRVVKMVSSFLGLFKK